MAPHEHDDAAESGAFLTARTATDRGAYLRWFKSEGVDRRDPAAVSAADARWRTLPLLRVPGLLPLAERALAGALGRRATAADRFPASLWLGGARDTDDGRDFLGNLGHFVQLLRDRAHVTAPKGRGWVIEPTTNPSGRRTNEATVAVHALFLDCDATGAWDRLLATLSQLDYAYVAYQSGGWTPELPKWRVCLPLHAPFATNSDAGIRAWKGIYNHARIVFGAVANLLSVGFDPATETPCCPWFLTEKRTPETPERVVVARTEGRALDLAALALALPDIPEEAPEAASQVNVEKLTLSEERLVEIVDAIAAVTSHVPVGRRDLYLALPGALLDRGVPPDDVYAIIEGVSASYPRHHAEKHADNLHNARTTISRWEAGTHYTRIGVLQTVAPDVAAAIDRVLPNWATKGAADTLAMQLSQPAPNFPTVTASATVEHATPAPLQVVNRRPKLNTFGRGASKLASRLKTSKKDELRLSGLLIECLLKGAVFPTIDVMSVEEMVNRVMGSLGRGMPLTATWAEAQDFALPSLSAMGFVQSVERMAMAERAFYEGRGRRGKSNARKAAETEKYKELIKRRQEEFAQIDRQKVRG